MMCHELIPTPFSFIQKKKRKYFCSTNIKKIKSSSHSPKQRTSWKKYFSNHTDSISVNLNNKPLAFQQRPRSLHNLYSVKRVSVDQPGNFSSNNVWCNFVGLCESTKGIQVIIIAWVTSDEVMNFPQMMLSRLSRSNARIINTEFPIP